MSLTCKDGVPSLSVVFALEDTWIHIHSVNYSNVAPDVKTPVN